jgi:hypothetical protein
MLLTKEVTIYRKKYSYLAIAWFMLAAIGALLKIRIGRETMGDYVIFTNAFWHAVHQISLYQIYPAEKVGSYLYGPLFSIFIAPFSLMPFYVGAFMWCIINAGLLFLAIRLLPLNYKSQQIILAVSLIEMMTCIENMEINCLIAAFIILSYLHVERRKDFWAAFFIAAGFLLKLYGIVGISFFLFSKNKLSFALSFAFWMLVLFLLPMVISSPAYILLCYPEWYHTLVAKNALNHDSIMQNISIMGMLSHIFNIKGINAEILMGAALFYALPLLRIKEYTNARFRLTYLAFLLIGIVIFSSAAESPTYIIAMSGAGIWFSYQNLQNRTIFSLLIFSLLITSLSSTDFFPSYLKSEYIKPYSLKVLPMIFLWIVIAWQLLFRKFKLAQEAN